MHSESLESEYFGNSIKKTLFVPGGNRTIFLVPLLIKRPKRLGRFAAEERINAHGPTRPVSLESRRGLNSGSAASFSPPDRLSCTVFAVTPATMASQNMDPAAPAASSAAALKGSDSGSSAARGSVSKR